MASPGMRPGPCTHKSRLVGNGWSMSGLELLADLGRTWRQVREVPNAEVTPSHCDVLRRQQTFTKEAISAVRYVNALAKMARDR